jgi:hypothetical protein
MTKGEQARLTAPGGASNFS